MEMMTYYGSLLECAKRSKIKTSTKQKTQNTMMCCARKQVNETVVKETCLRATLPQTRCTLPVQMDRISYCKGEGSRLSAPACQILSKSEPFLHEKKSKLNSYNSHGATINFCSVTLTARYWLLSC